MVYEAKQVMAVVWSNTRSPLTISINVTQMDTRLTQRNCAIAEIDQQIFNAYRDQRKSR